MLPAPALHGKCSNVLPSRVPPSMTAPISTPFYYSLHARMEWLEHAPQTAASGSNADLSLPLWPGESVLLAILTGCNGSTPDAHVLLCFSRLMCMLPLELSMKPKLIRTGTRGHMHCFECTLPELLEEVIYRFTLPSAQIAHSICHAAHPSKMREGYRAKLGCWLPL